MRPPCIVLMCAHARLAVALRNVVPARRHVGFEKALVAAQCWHRCNNGREGQSGNIDDRQAFVIGVMADRVQRSCCDQHDPIRSIMAWCPTTPLSDAMAQPGANRTWLSDLLRWIAEARSHRVICLVLGIWVFNGFDLAFTIISHQQGMLHEENPLARHMLQYGTTSIVLYKIGLVLIGSYPFLRFRRARISELGAYTILIAYAFLAIHWSMCVDWYTITLVNDINLAGIANTSFAPPQ